jgi:hypothetical protein
MKFYITVDGKEKPAKFSSEEYERYKNICLTIWGGMPHDVTWAQGTQIYKDAEKRLYAQVVER